MKLDIPLAELIVRSEEGDPLSQFALGSYYRHENQVGSFERAVFWTREAAAQDYAPAQVELGLLCLAGSLRSEHVREAKDWLKLAAQRGCLVSRDILQRLSAEDDCDETELLVEAAESDITAQFILGNAWLSSSSPTTKAEGLRLIWLAALTGHAEAQAIIGYHFLFGTIVTRDPIEAFKWLSLSARQDHPEAYYYLGACYREGWGVAQNDEQAFACLLRSAVAGNSNAQYHLALFYFDGIGVAPNEEQAMAWRNAAATQGHEEAKTMARWI